MTKATNEPNTMPEKMRPIAVHVEHIKYDVDLTHTYRKRVAVIDLEFTHQHAKELIENLQKRIDSERGAIRVRFEGRMVLE